MGITYIDAVVKDLKNEKTQVNVKFLVDTGAVYTLLPQNAAKKLGIKPRREQEFTLADGQTVKRKMGTAFVGVNGYSEATTVIIGESGDSALLGTVTLEQMGLMVDPFKRKLRPIKSLMM